MSSIFFRPLLLAALVFVAGFASAQNAASITLQQALQKALSANPRIAAAERDAGIAAGRAIQAGKIPNPELSAEVENVLGSGAYRDFRSAETTLQLSQLIELPNKRDARITGTLAQVDSVNWQREAARLEVMSETATAFVNVFSAQQRVRILEQQVSSLDRLAPLLQRRIDSGASSPAEVLRSQLAANLVKAQLERARTSLATARRELALLMGDNRLRIGNVTGQFTTIGRPPAFQTVLDGIEGNPQLMRWTAERAQRQAELLSARLKPIPDVRVSAGWRHYRETGEDAMTLGLSATLPLWDQNQGETQAASQSLEKVQAERAINKAALVSLAGRSYDAASGALKEIELLRNGALPLARQAVGTIEEGYAQGRFSLLEVLDAQASITEALLREQEALQSFHTAIITIEGLVGRPFVLSERIR